MDLIHIIAAKVVTEREKDKRYFVLTKREPLSRFSVFYLVSNYLLASSIATATATVIPTMGLLPAPMRPIISTCAGTEEEPAN